MADDLTGTWHGVYAEVDGQAAPAGYASSLEATYQGNGFSIRVKGTVQHEGTYSVDDKVEPHQITFVYTKSSRFPLNTPRVGIFQLTGDTYKNCLGPAGAKPPSNFNTTATSDTVMTVLTKGPASTAPTGAAPAVTADAVHLTLAW
jgi:uncharacterized protein (TIGR03067 family)